MLTTATFLLMTFFSGAFDVKEMDPAKGQVPLPCARDWEAFLVYDNGETGIWTVGTFNVFETYGTPEIVGLDDNGRCHVLISYSGKWTPRDIIHDGKWLGGLTHYDLDPRIPGKELYTGGMNGNLYQVGCYPYGTLDCRLIHTFPGLEIHSLLAGDHDPNNKGDELLIFTRPGGVYRASLIAPDGRFEVKKLRELPGRVRDAKVIPPLSSGASEMIILALRSGMLALLEMTGDDPVLTPLYEAPMGMGRLSYQNVNDQNILYSTLDDGRIMRHELSDRAISRSEVIYNGPQGPRGIAAGRFDRDSDVETVMVFGYSADVQLLSKRESGWDVETIYTDRDKGHWLSVAELDGRNSTDEVIGSGYGGRIFMLSRPPGFGLDDAIPTARTKPEHEAWDDSVPRVAIQASELNPKALTPLSYKGGFQTKSPIFETLVRRDSKGHVVPALASSWRYEGFDIPDDLRSTDRTPPSVVFELREGSRYHDGSPVDARSVATHFRQWVGVPEHDWLPANKHIKSIVVESDRVFRLVLNEPYDVTLDLCAINPCAIQGPGSFDSQGQMVAPIGSGPFRYVPNEDPRRLRLELIGQNGGTGRFVVLVAYSSTTPFDELLHDMKLGKLDLIADGWYEQVPRERVSHLENDEALRVSTSPGSSVYYLSFGPALMESRSTRRAIHASIDRDRIIEEVERGFADPSDGWAAPTVSAWPCPQVTIPVSSTTPKPGSTLRVLLDTSDRRQSSLGEALRTQLEAAGFAVNFCLSEGESLMRITEAGEFDVRIERTWGLPYDPYLSLVDRFCSSKSPAWSVFDNRLKAKIQELGKCTDRTVRFRIAEEIQSLLTSESIVVPLYSPNRLCVSRADAQPIDLTNDSYRTDLEALIR